MQFYVFPLIALVAFATCTPVDQNVPTAYKNGRYLTTGVATRAGGGKPYIRREIRDLKEYHPESWSLYLLGLLAFQQIDQNDPLSYYHISGIHGRPWVPWQDANGVQNASGQGYCPHNNMMFGAWHRPYIALFEQELYKQVRKIADQATTGQRRWIMAADAFRVPYWDWTSGLKGGELPEFFTTPLITITGPLGQQIIANPLYQYNFHPASAPDFSNDWANMNTTVRCPASHDPNIPSRNELVRQNFLTYRRQWHDSIAKAFSEKVHYNSFATELELIHGGPHFAIGCAESQGAPGHMWIFEYSAFEPMFMLVHANVDRLIALYQAIRPDTWMEPASSQGAGNFWIPNHATLDADMQMQPFWKDGNTFYTPNDIRNTSIFGYAYPETQYWNYASIADWRAAVNASVSVLYSLSARTLLTSSHQSTTNLAYLLKNSTFTDWTINIKASTLDMPSNFIVKFSLTSISSLDQSTEVGIWLRQMPGSHGGQLWKTRWFRKKMKRIDAPGHSIEGTISLTSSLLDRVTSGELKSLEAVDVVPYLNAHLTWTIPGALGFHTQDEEQKILTIDVVSAQVRIPDNPEQALEYSSDKILHPEATRKL